MFILKCIKHRLPEGTTVFIGAETFMVGNTSNKGNIILNNKLSCRVGLPKKIPADVYKLLIYKENTKYIGEL